MFVFFTIFIHNVKAYDNQYFIQTPAQEYLTEYDKLLQSVCTPIKFTRSGMRCFLKHTFNRKEYAQDILPHTMNHLTQFLDYGKKTNQDGAFIQSTLRLFNNKLKSCSYITPYTFCQTVERFPELLKSYIVEQPEGASWLVQIKSMFKKILYSTFLAKFSLFKKDPEQFFDSLSENMLDELQQSSYLQEAVNQEQLRQNVIRLLETMLNKIIWSPLDQADVWNSVKTIFTDLHRLMQEDIINQEELDDLLKSAIERFVYFLELTGSELSLDLIETIKNDLDAENLIINQIEEQEEFIESKSERLRKAIMETEAKIHARLHGIITEVISY